MIRLLALRAVAVLLTVLTALSVSAAERAEWRLVHRLEVGDPAAMRFSPDSRLLAVASTAGVSLWGTADGTERGAAKAHFVTSEDAKYAYSDIRGLQFTSDGNGLVTAARDGRIIVWTVPELEGVRSLREPELQGDRQVAASWCHVPIESMSSLQGDCLALSLDESAELWNLVTGRQTWLLGTQLAVQRLGIEELLNSVPDTQRQFAQGQLARLLAAFPEPGKAAEALRSTKHVSWVDGSARKAPGIKHVELSDSCELLAVAHGDHLEVWQVSNRKKLWDRRRAAFCTFSPDGRHLVCGGRWSKALLCEGRTGNVVREFPVSFDAAPSFSRDGRVMCAPASAKLVLFETTSWQILGEVHHEEPIWEVIDFAVSSDAGMVAVSWKRLNSGRVELWKRLDERTP